MGLGTYSYAKATTKCGCDVEVQVFLAGSAQHVGTQLHQRTVHIVQMRATRICGTPLLTPSLPVIVQERLP